MKSQKSLTKLQEWQVLYHRIAQVITDEPEIPSGDRRDTAEVLMWLGRVGALIMQVNGIADHAKFKNYRQSLLVTTKYSPDVQMRHIRSLLYAVLAKAELKAPTVADGSFIPAGNVSDAVAAVTGILDRCRGHLMVVDPHLDAMALTRYLAVDVDGAALRLLVGEERGSSDLSKEVSETRIRRSRGSLIELRYAPERLLHDRLIMDDSNVWSLSQSFNVLAEGSPAMIQRLGRDVAAVKRQAYFELWDRSIPIGSVRRLAV